MKMKGWGTHWGWERSKEVAVFAVDNKVEQEKAVVIKELEEVLKEFSIPIDVVNGNLRHRDDGALIQTLFDDSMKDNRIDSDEFEQAVRKVREDGRLPYGLVVLADKDKYEFYEPPGQKEPAIYGGGVPDGMVILRYTHREAVRHEFGHMLGLGIHHKECVMDYRCVTPAFCTQCKKQIGEMWQEEIAKGR